MNNPIPMGYSSLVEQLQLSVIPHYRASFLLMHGRGACVQKGRIIHVCYPKSYAIADLDDLMLQCEFAIKHDGINLMILSVFFRQIAPSTLSSFIMEKPTSKYRRIIWFLYEFLTDQKLNVDDVRNTPYVKLLDDNDYIVGSERKSKRHAIVNNLLGNQDFCPVVRRTEKIAGFQQGNMEQKMASLLGTAEPAVLARAMHFLYTRETKSSFSIEHVKPSRERLQRFISVLESVGDITTLDRNKLVELQNAIVEQPYQEQGYRDAQNYVAEMTRLYEEKIHYISPKPEDVDSLMSGLMEFEHASLELNCHPVITAAVAAFGFVFIHPFEDGNGRIHRFLIHYMLSKLGFTPDRVIFPVSSVMLKAIREYDAVLESFSRPLLEAIGAYDLSDAGELTVPGNARYFYQHIDYTAFVEYLFDCVNQTIDEDFQEEIIFIERYDKTKVAIQAIVDMPDIKIDRIIKCIAENDGKLGKKRRETMFQELSDEIVSQIEVVVRRIMEV